MHQLAIVPEKVGLVSNNMLQAKHARLSSSSTSSKDVLRPLIAVGITQ